MSIQELMKEKYLTLSKGQKKVADLLLKDVATFSMSTALQIAKQADVSETTVVRLSYALDFESFSQMQKFIQKDYLSKKEMGPVALNDEKNNSNDFIDDLIDKEIDILKSLKSSLNMNHFWMAIDEIMGADEVKIVGFRASYSAAHWLYLKLNMMRTNVDLITSNTSNYPDNLLVDRDKKIVFIFISLPSYATPSLEIAEMAKKQGAKLITITDHLLSPISRISDITLTTQINASSESFIPISSVMSLLNIIATGIETKYEKEVIERVLRLQNLYKEKEFFLE
ncbi:MurR/RpiR family transcriptional regulator [Bacillus sp. MRMR6]|uniref:MurR/RpiR family transcriptional regulator n=1 Tax=Bacillus sp. MRMR6 TaxID=1928617 RepID=UPI000951CE9B|nr:MurR/RpiR family transcriptional regulator [Bacillus sp. MRMR6]OLS37311.1 hypothetical protein BTR25_16260 [Bacillus sp. MRMR6]